MDFDCSMGNDSDASGASRSFVDSILKKSAPQATTEPAAPEEPSNLSESDLAPDPEAYDEEAWALAELYFELEVPQERDALVERLASNPSSIATEFFVAMMHEDEEDSMRAIAAAEAGRRGVAEAIGLLEDHLEEPEEHFFFQVSIRALAEIQGQAFYPRLLDLWLDPERDADQRVEAMLGMELLDVERALKDFMTLVQETKSAETMLDDQIEFAMVAFARHQYDAGIPALEDLALVVKSARTIDVDERQELLEFLREGIDLIKTPTDD